MAKQVQEKPFTNMEVSAFCGQIALILKSGISSLEGITIMLEDAASADEKDILQAVLDHMQETGSMYQALENTGLFPSYMLHMIQIGEETGTLDEVMSALSEHYDREDSIAKSIKNAVTYPLIMAGMTGFSRTLMGIGNAINHYSIVFVAILVVIAALILFGTRTASGKQMSRNIGYKFRFTRVIYEEIAACRFASGMALTLSSGLNPERSMELVSALNDDVHFQKKIDACQSLIDEGQDLAEALHGTGILTGMYARMASIGAKTGSMDQVMDNIAGLYQDDIDTRMNNSLAVLEPTLVIALSLIVGVILLSVMLPLMGIMSSI